MAIKDFKNGIKVISFWKNNKKKKKDKKGKIKKKLRCYLHLGFCHDFASSFCPESNFGGKTNQDTSACGVGALFAPFHNTWLVLRDLVHATGGKWRGGISYRPTPLRLITVPSLSIGCGSGPNRRPRWTGLGKHASLR